MKGFEVIYKGKTYFKGFDQGGVTTIIINKTEVVFILNSED